MQNQSKQEKKVPSASTEESNDLLTEVTTLISKQFEKKSKEIQEKQKELEEREAKVNHILEEQTRTKQVTIRVGEKLFYCSTTVLLSEKDSFFSGLLNPQFQRSEDAYFIPRDPRAFEYVLEYLTYSTLLSKIKDENILRKLAKDADYYLLPKLKEQAELQLTEIAKKNKQKELNSNAPSVTSNAAKVFAKVQNGTLSGSGQYWTWNSSISMPPQYFQLTTRNNSNDTITVKQPGTYLVTVRVGLSASAGYHTSLYVNGTESARSYSSASSNYNQSFHINEVLSLTANAQIQVYSTYNSSPLNGDPHNSFSVVML